MACEVPVISSNIGGLPEVNVHGETGFLSDVGDVNDMAKNALSILESDDELAKFKSQAYEHSQLFAIENILPKYEALYERLIQEKQD